jgi:hypothetical protein
VIVPVWARYGAVVALVLGALYGAYRHGVTTERTRAELLAETGRSEAARMIITEQRRSRAAAVALDAYYTGELINAQKRIEELERGSADVKPARVFVKATCPARLEPVPEAGTLAGVGGRSEQGPELVGVFRSDYFDLLRAIEVKEKALAFCVAAAQE